MPFIPFMIAFIVGTIYGRIVGDTTAVFNRIAPSVVPYMGFVDGVRTAYFLLLTYGILEIELFFIITPLIGLGVMLKFVPIIDKSTTEKELIDQCKRQIQATGVFLLVTAIGLWILY